MSDWRPIDTAPLTGEFVLLYLDPPLRTGDTIGHWDHGDLRVVVGYPRDTYRGQIEWNAGFCEEGAADSEGCSVPFQITVHPTHWMPLPNGPSNPTGAEGKTE